MELLITGINNLTFRSTYRNHYRTENGGSFVLGDVKLIIFICLRKCVH